MSGPLPSQQVAPAAGNDVDHRLARGFAGTHGVLVGVDVDAVVGIAEMGTLGKARWASVRMGMLASAEAPAAKRKKVRRERPLQPMGSSDGLHGNDSFERSSGLDVAVDVRELRPKDNRCREDRGNGIPYPKLSSIVLKNKGEMRKEIHVLLYAVRLLEIRRMRFLQPDSRTMSCHRLTLWAPAVASEIWTGGFCRALKIG